MFKHLESYEDSVVSKKNKFDIKKTVQCAKYISTLEKKDCFLLSSGDKKISVWSIVKEKELMSIEAEDHVVALTGIPESNQAAVTLKNNKICIFDLDSGSKVSEFNNLANSRKDRKASLLGVHDNILIGSIASNVGYWKLSQKGTFSNCSWSNGDDSFLNFIILKSDILLGLRRSHMMYNGKDYYRCIAKWNLKEKSISSQYISQQWLQLKVENFFYTAIAKIDDEYFLLGLNNGSVQICKVSYNELSKENAYVLMTFDAHIQHEVTNLAFCSKRKYIATSGSDSTCRIWDASLFFEENKVRCLHIIEDIDPHAPLIWLSEDKLCIGGGKMKFVNFNAQEENLIEQKKELESNNNSEKNSLAIDEFFKAKSQMEKLPSIKQSFLGAQFKFSYDLWVLSLVRDGNNNPQHAFLVVEGMNQFGKLMLFRYELVKHKKWDGYADILIRTNENEETYDEKKIREILKLDQGKFYFSSWMISRQQAKELADNVSADYKLANDFKFGIPYQFSGDTSLFAKASSVEGHNCFTWARLQIEKLGDPNIKINKKITDWLVVPSSLYLPDPDKKEGTMYLPAIATVAILGTTAVVATKKCVIQ